MACTYTNEILIISIQFLIASSPSCFLDGQMTSIPTPLKF